MFNALSALRPEDREAVIYYDDGKVYVNRPELSNGPFYLRAY